MPLSKQQVIFLKMAKSGTAPRSLKNRTGISLNKLGLINYTPMFGWNLTSKGVEVLEGAN